MTQKAKQLAQSGVPKPATGLASTYPESKTEEAFGSLRVAMVAHIPPLLEALGCDSALVLRHAGLSRKLLAHPENRIGFHTAGRLLEESVRATGLAHFGLLAGEHFDPAVALGDAIELMRNAPSVEVALRAFVLQHHLNDSGAVPMLLPVGAKRLVLAYTIFSHEVPGIDTFYDAAIAYGVQIMRSLCGRNWRPLQVKLARRRPADTTPYARMLGPKVLFDSNVYAIEFASHLLEQPIVGANPGRFALLRDEMQQRLLRDKIGFADQVRRALLPMILAGTAASSSVATLFSMHERVLRDRLAAEGASLRTLLQGTKLEVAAQLLRSTQLTVGEISAAVGYSDPPSFVRAFRRHTGGVPPGEWRVQGMANAER